MSKTMEKVLSLLALEPSLARNRRGRRGEYKVIEIESATELQGALNEEPGTNGFTYCGDDGSNLVLFRK